MSSVNDELMYKGNCNVVTATRDASGNVVAFQSGGLSTIPQDVLQSDAAYMRSLFGDVAKKVLAKTAADTYYLSIPKATGRATALVYEIKKGIVTTTDSVGGAAQLFRVTKVTEVVRAMVAMHGYSAVNSAGDWTQATYSLPGQAGAYGTGSWGAAVKYRQTIVQNAYIEYAITVGNEGVFSVGFAVAAGNSASVRVAIDGVSQGDFSTVASAGSVWIKPYSTSPGTHTIRVTKLDAGSLPMQVFGANFYDASDLPEGNTIDSWAYGRTANYYKNASLGAIDYAMKVSGGSWSGSYHGGETATSALVLVDGVDVAASAIGTISVGSNIVFEQATTIATGAGTVTMTSRYRWAQNGGHTFQAIAETGTIPFEYFYTLMDVLEPGFNTVVYPQILDYSAVAVDTRTSIGPAEMIIIKNPTTGQQAATWGRQFGIANNEYNGMHCWHNPGVYSKPYNGPAVGADNAVLGTFEFVSMHAYF